MEREPAPDLPVKLGADRDDIRIVPALLAGAVMREREFGGDPDALVQINRIVAESAKAVRDLGYKVTSLEEMFRDEVEWLKENNLLTRSTPWVWP